MKSLTFLAFLAALFILSCMDTPIAPIKSDNQPVQLIKLPPKAGLNVETPIFVTKTIYGEDGGTLKIKESYVALDGHTVNVDVILKIKKNSFSGEETITMTVGDDYAGVEFFPPMTFSKATELDVTFEGIDLNELDSRSGNYDFVYADSDGNVLDADIDYNQLQVKESQREISVKKAKLNHFSRYAFIR
jgi:hypothetical protein